jgi:hypothetical protein
MGAASEAIAVTNNPSITCSDNGIRIRYRRASAFEVMKDAEQLIYEGYKLLAHPLSANWQMNTSPYKTIFLKKTEAIDSYSVFTITKCVMWLTNLPRAKFGLQDELEKIFLDYQFIDRELFVNVLTNYKASPGTY